MNCQGWASEDLSSVLGILVRNYVYRAFGNNLFYSSIKSVRRYRKRCFTKCFIQILLSSIKMEICHGMSKKDSRIQKSFFDSEVFFWFKIFFFFQILLSFKTGDPMKKDLWWFFKSTCLFRQFSLIFALRGVPNPQKIRRASRAEHLHFPKVFKVFHKKRGSQREKKARFARQNRQSSKVFDSKVFFWFRDLFLLSNSSFNQIRVLL